MICGFCKQDKPRLEFGAPPKPGYQHWCKACERNRQSVRKHGITIEQKQQIAEHQGGCAICGHKDPGSKGWTVDHDHECCDGEKSCPKCRRGILCGWCNKMLAYAFDRPQTLTAAIEYLQRHASGTCDWHMPLACASGICTYERSTRTNEEPSADLRENPTLGNARRGGCTNA